MLEEFGNMNDPGQKPSVASRTVKGTRPGLRETDRFRRSLAHLAHGIHLWGVTSRPVIHLLLLGLDCGRPAWR